MSRWCETWRRRRAIWPQEIPLIQRYKLPPAPRILDAGCGKGEGASRLAQLFTDAPVTGVDIIDAHLDVARSRYADLGPRLSFEHQSIYELKDGDGAFDLTSAATCFTRYRSRSE